MYAGRRLHAHEYNSITIALTAVNAIFFFYVFFFLFNFYLFIFFYKKFMPLSARGTTVAQANSECTLITIRMYLSVI